jgi:hypothetical protein
MIRPLCRSAGEILCGDFARDCIRIAPRSPQRTSFRFKILNGFKGSLAWYTSCWRNRDADFCALIFVDDGACSAASHASVAKVKGRSVM